MAEKTQNEGGLEKESRERAGANEEGYREENLGSEGQNSGDFDRGSDGGPNESTGGDSKESLGAKIAELEGLTEWFYSEDFRLEEATGRYKEAIALAKEIERDLTELKNEIEVLTQDFSK